MSRKLKRNKSLVKITKQHITNLRHHGPTALRRRDAKFFFNGVIGSLQFSLTGLIPILGVALFGGTASDWVVFFLVNSWTAVLCDAIRVVFLDKEVERFLESRGDDEVVWLTAEAVRQNKEYFDGQYVPKGNQSRLGIVFDFLFGTVSTFAILQTISQIEPLSDFFLNSFFVVATIAKVLLSVVFVGWEIAEIKNAESKRLTEASARNKVTPVKVYAGLHGFGMFVLMFVVLILTDGGQEYGNERLIVYIFNGFLLALAAMNLWGLAMLHANARWLRQYLAADKKKKSR